jgi:4-hydroxy-tetrahydrodipicolinate synthase
MSNLTAKDLYGCMTALVTPMNASGEINYKQWQKVLQWQIDSGVKAVIVAGTTGESAVLSKAEFTQLLKVAVEVCKDTATHVIAQTGAISAETVIEYNNISHQIGANAVLVVTPYYLRTTQEGLYQHFMKIAEVSPLPIILYNVPTRTQNDLYAKTTVRLAQHNRIIAIKEAALDESRISELAKKIPEDFSILSGNDDTFLKSMQHGARGVISVASNTQPKTVTEICTLMDLGDVISAKKLNSSLENLYKMLSCQPNPIPVKFLLQQAGLISEGIRLPLVWFNGYFSGIKRLIKQTKEDYSNL